LHFLLSRIYPTGAISVVAGATFLNKINKNLYTYRSLDSIIVPYGRNEANDGDSAYSHYRA